MISVDDFEPVAKIEYSSMHNRFAHLSRWFRDPSHFRALFFTALVVVGVIITTVLTFHQQDNRSAASTSGVDFVVVPSSKQLSPGDQFTWDIFMNTQQHPLNAVLLEIGYDPNSFDFVSLTPGTLMSDTVMPGVGGNGKATIVLGTKPTQVTSSPTPTYSISPYMGSGIIAHLTLKAKVGITTSSVITINAERSDGSGTIALAKDSGSTNVTGDKTSGTVQIGTVSPSPAISSPSPTPSPSVAASPTSVSPSPISATTGPDIVTITSAKIVRSNKQGDKIEVYATSNRQPSATLTVQGIGQMQYIAKNNVYFYSTTLNQVPTTITVTSSLGGASTSPIAH
jgi:hypothetical protein